MAKRVIDISYAQGFVNFEALKPYVDGVIIQLGYGSDMTSQDDVQFDRSVRECERLGIPYGIYIYAYADTDWRIDSEIAHTLRQARKCNPKLGVFTDLEENKNGWLSAKYVERFCKAINDAGYKAGVYCGAYYYRSYLMGVYERVKALWWMAAYPPTNKDNGTLQPQYKPNPGFPYQAWQYSSQGHLPGIASTCTVDMNEWYVDFNSDAPAPEPTPLKVPSVRYAIKTLHHGIREFKKNGEVAGHLNDAITGIAIGVDSGSVKYRVHLLSGRWLPWVYGCDWKDSENGYAGDGDEVIDAVQIMYYTDTAETAGKYYEAVYSVRPVNYGFLPSVYDTDGNDADGDGTAGIFGAPFVEIKISLHKC